MNNVEALKGLYVALGGSLTDTYDDIANGIPVSNYTIIPECISALSKKAVPAETGPSIKYINATQSGNTITFDGETQKSIYEMVSGGNTEVVIVAKQGSNEQYHYFRPTDLTNINSTFLYVHRDATGALTTHYTEFAVSKTSTSNSVTSSSQSSEDYSSGGPT